MDSEVKAEVFESGHSQAVRIPAQYRFSSKHVYLEYDAQQGTLTLSEKPLHPSAEELNTQRIARTQQLRELFAKMDSDGGFDFDLERDLRPAEERAWF